MNNTNTQNKLRYGSSVGQSLSGKYKIAVIDQAENIVWEQKDWAKNLILNQGMEALAPGSLPTHGVDYANCFALAMMGTGTRYNSIEVGLVGGGEGSGSCSGTTFTFTPGISGLTNVTASAGNGYSSAISIGDMIKFSGSGEEIRVTAIGINNTLTVTPSTTVTPDKPFTIWKTSQVGLQSLTHVVGQANMYVNGASYNGTVTTAGYGVQERRTWDFAYETSSVVVSEVGVGWSTNGDNYYFASSPSAVFSRVLLPTTTSLTSGQKLRLIYELDIALSPNVVSGSVSGIGFGLPFTASIGGSNPWPVSPNGGTVISSSGGYYNLQSYDISYVDVNGTTQKNDGYMDPSNNVALFWSDSAAQLLGSGVGSNSRLGAAGTYDTITATPDPYTALSFTCTKTGVFAASLGSSNIRSFGIQSSGVGYPSTQTLACLFFQPQQKTTVQTLSLTFQYSWGRTLA
jgi:hypothetical protein